MENAKKCSEKVTMLLAYGNATSPPTRSQPNISPTECQMPKISVLVSPDKINILIVGWWTGRFAALAPSVFSPHGRSGTVLLMKNNNAVSP
jgi:hypothetical protein